jgi:LysR family transcriptional regulator, nitrogen assimilation regulatory protein
MPLSLKQLRYFVAVADAGALSVAAETLNIAQSALSHHVGDMEAALGVQLLERSARGVALTASGQRLYEHAGAILTALERAEADVRTVAGMPSGPIAVGLCHRAVEVVSLPIMQETRRQWPDIRLTLVEGLSGGLIERVLSGELDFAVAYNPPPDRRLRSVAVLEEQLYLVGIPAIIGADTDPIPFGAIPFQHMGNARPTPSLKRSKKVGNRHAAAGRHSRASVHATAQRKQAGTPRRSRDEPRLAAPSSGQCPA